ncbi:UNVERIFIED_CONTAM: hypothetical protein PYX00_006747 [Menopon gallinae]|uniref:Major facilitator superfamily (MFS) profile domain-containing protein n=1 Tax=Menopon gallinae TaxID=328185 RepID=A0AAW2HXX3_9NEOP
MTLAPAPKRRVSQDEDACAEVAESTPSPPDGGWGWMVVFASFMIHIVTDGITYSFGVFYVEFLNYFQEGKGATAWIASIMVGVTFCSGPISSSFVNKYGCRAVTIAGSILGFICIALSIYAKNVLTLYFTIGIGAGLGFGLIYLPAIVSVTCYFEKYRSLATGIAVCGSGLGTFIYAPLTEFFVAEYGWRGAMLLISSLVLQCATFGALFRPVEEYQKPAKKVVPRREQKSIENSLTVDIGKRNGGAPMQRPISMCNFSPPRIVQTGRRNQSETARMALSQPALVNLTTNTQKLEYSRRNFGSSGIMQRKDVFYYASLHNIPQYNPRQAVSRSSMRLDKLPEEKRLLSEQEFHEEKPHRLCGIIPCPKDTLDTFNQMLDFSLLKDPIFILFTVSNFFTSIGFNVPYLYIVAQARERGLTKETASYLLSVIGIANTIGRVILGYISDKTWVNRLLIYNSCLTICGIATGLSALCYDFYSFALYGTVFGFTIGAYVGLTSVILVDLLGLDHLTNAFGLLLLFQGIASFVGPPIAGWLYDAFETYDPGFAVAGTMIALSGLMLFAIPPMQRYYNKRNNKNDIEREDDDERQRT